MKVFIAEDNPILLRGLERALTANGYDVKTAVHGRAILEMLETGPLPDMLLLDVMMPELSGTEVLHAVREDPRTAHLPVMLITAAAEEVVRQANADVLMKPFRLSELLSRIEQKVGPPRSQSESDSNRDVARPLPVSH